MHEISIDLSREGSLEAVDCFLFQVWDRSCTSREWEALVRCSSEKTSADSVHPSLVLLSGIHKHSDKHWIQLSNVLFESPLGMGRVNKGWRGRTNKLEVEVSNIKIECRNKWMKEERHLHYNCPSVLCVTKSVFDHRHPFILEQGSLSSNENIKVLNKRAESIEDTFVTKTWMNCSTQLENEVTWKDTIYKKNESYRQRLFKRNKVLSNSELRERKRTSFCSCFHLYSMLRSTRYEIFRIMIRRRHSEKNWKIALKRLWNKWSIHLHSKGSQGWEDGRKCKKEKLTLKEFSLVFLCWTNEDMSGRSPTLPLECVSLHKYISQNVSIAKYQKPGMKEETDE
jgi:hypothetical protein